MAEESETGQVTDKKQKRIEKKKKKLLVEYELTKSNDAVKRPGILLDSPEVESKKEKLESTDGEDKQENAKRLSDEEFKVLKKQLAERKKVLKNLPRLTLQYAGISAQINEEEKRIPLLMADIQHLLVYALCGNDVTAPPRRWCQLEKASNLTSIFALVVEGLNVEDYLLGRESFKSLNENFPQKAEVIASSHYGRSPAQEFSTYPLTACVKRKFLAKFGSLKAAMDSNVVTESLRTLFPISGVQSSDDKAKVDRNQAAKVDSDETVKVDSDETVKVDNDEAVKVKVESGAEVPVVSVPPVLTCLPEKDVFPRTYLLLNTHQMMMENYPLPVDSLNPDQEFKSYTMSRKSYSEVHPSSPMFGLDCEMCFTTNQRLELTHIAVVNEEHKVIYETYVKPRARITNYLTQFSGITPDKLADVKTRSEDVVRKLRELLPSDAILVGHSLNSDLIAIGISHPYVIDTSVIFNVTGNRLRKSKLSHLVEVFLHETIQKSAHGHSPSEDAIAALKLVQLKLAEGFHFGDSLAEASAAPPSEPKPVKATVTVTNPGVQLASSVFSTVSKANKTVKVIGTEEHIQHYIKLSTYDDAQLSSFSTTSVKKPKEAVKQIEGAIMSHNMCISHIDLTKKLSKCKTDEERAKVLRKLDAWCDKLYNALPWNGMGLVIFAGSESGNGTGCKTPDLNLSVNSDVNNSSIEIDSDSLGDTSGNSQSLDQTGASEIEESKMQQRRDNGAVFMRIKVLNPV